MSLQFILGNSGAGKSHFIFEKIIVESLERPDGKFFILVPEQFTMQSQRDLVEMHPRHATMNIDVLSFERLAHRVFDEVGGERRRVLEDTGKNLILRRLAEEKESELTLLGGSLKKLGYISEVKSLLSEFVQYRVTPEMLGEMAERNQGNPQLSFKLKDMQIIYEGFQRYLEGTFLTGEELLGALEQKVEESAAVRGSVIVLDGYTGFTPVQLGLIGKLMELTDRIYVTLTLDSRENPFEMDAEYCLFHMTKKTIESLYRLADRTRTEVLRPVVLQEKPVYRFRQAPALAFLESHVFRHGKQFWEGKTDELRLFAAASPGAEVDRIGRRICALVRDEGFRYRDVAVVTGDLETYGAYLEQAFAKYGIPAFIDRKRDVLKNPFVEFLRALLAAVAEDFSYEAMFRMLRSGMSAVDARETDVLENYVLARGIRGFAAWNRAWTYLPKGMEPEELEALNALRQKAVAGLDALRAGLKRKGADARSMTRALYEYLVSLGIQEKLKRYEQRFEAAGDFAMAREYAQIYGMVMELFDKLVLLLGDCPVTPDEYAELLDAGLCEMKVGLIPAGSDQVVVGDMERSRLKDVKALFFAGVNEGNVPREKSRGGILSEMDREVLAGQEVELSPTSRQEAYIQRFYIYLTLTKPSAKLELSWSLADADGSALRPSFLIAQIQELFPGLDVETEEQEGFLERLTTPQGSVGELTGALRAAREGGADELQAALIRWYDGQEEWQEKLLRLMDAVSFVKREDPLSKAVARALYGTLLEGSVTRLEQFAACAYAHFLQYGLWLQERETAGIQPVDLGNVFHAALKYFSDAVEHGGYGWFDVPDEKRDQWMDEALTRAMDDYADRVYSDRAKDAYTMERVRRISRRTAWAILEQIRKGAFAPEQTEVSFRDLEQLSSVSVLLSEDERMRLRGRIDRIDVCRRDGKVYVRVVDYKSGNTRFDLTSVYYGLQLQLVVYLNAAMELAARNGAGEAHPAGMFYYHIDDPILEYEEEDEPERRLLRELAFHGLANSEPEVIGLQDRELSPSASSEILPVRMKKDGELSAASSAGTEEQMRELSRHVQRKLSEYGKRILDGDISLKPYEMGDETACSFCKFHEVCGFDRRLPGCEKRRLHPMEREEVWEAIRKEQA